MPRSSPRRPGGAGLSGRGLAQQIVMEAQGAASDKTPSWNRTYTQCASSPTQSRTEARTRSRRSAPCPRRPLSYTNWQSRRPAQQPVASEGPDLRERPLRGGEFAFVLGEPHARGRAVYQARVSGGHAGPPDLRGRGRHRRDASNALRMACRHGQPLRFRRHSSLS